MRTTHLASKRDYVLHDLGRRLRGVGGERGEVFYFDHAAAVVPGVRGDVTIAGADRSILVGIYEASRTVAFPVVVKASTSRG